MPFSRSIFLLSLPQGGKISSRDALRIVVKELEYMDVYSGLLSRFRIADGGRRQRPGLLRQTFAALKSLTLSRAAHVCWKPATKSAFAVRLRSRSRRMAAAVFAVLTSRPVSWRSSAPTHLHDQRSVQSHSCGAHDLCKRSLASHLDRVVGGACGESVEWTSWC